MNRWKDWLEQARLNHAHADRSLRMGDYAWACFAAQQAAGAAAKALHQRLGQVAWGHSVVDLLDALPQSAQGGTELTEQAKVLDKYYIPTAIPTPTRPGRPPATTRRSRPRKRSVWRGRWWTTVSVRVWRFDPSAARARLEAWARELGRDPAVLAVILFGSLARGEATPMSDADVLIVLSDSPLPFDERLARYKPVGLGVGTEVFPYTVQEARSGLAGGYGVVEVALREGVVLFERDDVRASLGYPVQA